mgnify:CR=1 FL=1
MNSADIAAKYQKTYFMPPEVTYDWVKKDSITKAPIWCSVDLRDGNQALIDPMSLEDKLEFFKLLVKIGFKEIEVGFPASSDTEYNFIRALIERNMIPEDVTIQVLTQAREHIIRKTFEAVKGAPHAVIHLYNSTSVEQREQVFKKDKEAIKKLAVDGARMLKNLADETEGNFTFEYSPESFSQTEVDYALEVCNAVLEVWKPTADRKAIINLPTTVQVAMPHVFACQVEYMHKHLKYRENVVLSVHPHNDRGCGISDAEFGVLAGADRVEGTLFGNGERTGNVDLVTVALNMMCHGVYSGLDFSHIMEIREAYENFTGMKVHERVPYAGDLVFTAFSGSHQDAINKGTQYMKESNSDFWEIPYLPIDPADVGREYEPIIRINSQSGKGGSAFVMQHSFGFDLPKAMHPEFGHIVQVETDRVGKELKPDAIYDLFKAHYIDAVKPYQLVQHSFAEFTDEEGHSHVTFAGTIRHTDTVFQVQGSGNGPIDAFFNAIHGQKMDRFTFIDYKEHAVKQGSDSQAVAYIHLQDENGRDWFGVGMSHNINLAPLKGILSAINRAVSHDGK